MTNVEKLKDIETVLGDVRQRLGAVDENDTSYDCLINQMSPYKIVSTYCAWHLGCDDWWKEFKQIYDELKNMEATNEHS